MIDSRTISALKQKARQLGFSLSGIALPKTPDHFDVYQNWLQSGRHAGMQYLATQSAQDKRADPLLILPECRSILVLGVPYSNPRLTSPEPGQVSQGRIAAYALGADYHLALPERLQALVAFLEDLLGQPVPNRYYTDTGPILERELAVRAGLGWIGKNSCLISPMRGSYFLLAEILLGVELPADTAFAVDHCGNCTRCIDACPTGCIQPDRTLDARRCISYQTIENKAEIPLELRARQGNWIFGCDICQMVCPWNIRFAALAGDEKFSSSSRPDVLNPDLSTELLLTPQEFNQKFKYSPLKRTKRRGYLRNVAIAVGNTQNPAYLPALEQAAQDDEALIREAASWAIKKINSA